MLRLPLCLLSFAGACATEAPPSAPLAYADAVVQVTQAPAEARRICAAVADPGLREDCLGAAAGELARADAAAAAALCGELGAGLARDECHFQVAERAGEVERCADAGRFADECRLHRLSADFRRLLPEGARPGGFEAALEPALAGYGLRVEDPRPWSAAYRWVLGGQRPLDRGSCAAAPSPAQVEACRMTALAVYNDLLNHARDKGSFPCDGGPLPARLAYLPDPDLDAIVARRRADDLCR